MLPAPSSRSTIRPQPGAIAWRMWPQQEMQSRGKPPTALRPTRVWSRLRCPGARLDTAVPQGMDLALRLAGFALDGENSGEQIVQPALVRWQCAFQDLRGLGQLPGVEQDPAQFEA